MSMKVEHQNLTQSIPKLYLHPDYADVHFEFKSNGQTALVPAHKNILAITSPIFAAMFFGPLKEKDFVEIVDATDSEFKEFLQFFYLPEVTLTMKNIEAVARLADKYDMMECLNACALFLEHQLNDGNMIFGYQLAISINHQRLKQICEHQIVSSTSNIFKSDAFLCCDEIVLERILRLGNPHIGGTDVFNGCIEWAKSSCCRNGFNENDAMNLKKALGECFYLIDFHAMTFQEIGQILSNKVHEDLFTRNELAELWCAKSVNNFTNKLFAHVPRSKTWNDDKVLECSAKSVGGQWIECNKNDSIWFSTNEPLLLGGRLQLMTVKGELTHLILFVIEYNAQSVSLDAEKEIMFREEVCNFSGSVSLDAEKDILFREEYSTFHFNLPQPILIRPNKMYEIRFELKKESECIKYLGYKWENQVMLDDKVVIKIHTKPSDTERLCSFFSLQFKRI